MSDIDHRSLDAHTEQDIHNFSARLCNPKFFELLTRLLKDRYYKPSQLDAETLKHLALIPRWLDCLTALPYPQYRFSPLLEQWLAADQKYRLRLGHRLLQTCTNPSGFAFPVMNDLLWVFLNELRQRLLSTAYHKRLYLDQREADDNYKSCCDYVNRLFKEGCSRYVVIRVDFSYQKEFASSVTFEQAQRDFQRLRNNARHHSLFNGLTGYIAKFEYGLDKHMHIHVYFFFDGHQRDGRYNWDEQLGRNIGEYWVNMLPKGTGNYWNCNDKKESRYKNVGIGLIDYRDIERGKNLLKAVWYLCKKETQHIKPRNQPQAKTLIKGCFNSGTRMGRPRSESFQDYFGMTEEELGRGRISAMRKAL